MSVLKYWNGTAWTRLTGAGVPGPIGPAGPQGSQGLPGMVRRPVAAMALNAYTLVLTDENTMIYTTANGGITITVPPNATVAFPIGAEIDLLWWSGTGQTTVAAGAGVIVYGVPGLKLRVSKSSATLKQIVLNQWILIGDLSL